MQRRDRRLHDVGAAAAQGQGTVEHRPPVGDLRRVPQRAILIGEQDEVPAAKPRAAAGVEQQHHRQQAVDLRLVGHQLCERPSEPDRLGRQLAAGGWRRISLVEDQVDDREHGGEPIGQQVVGRHPERDPGGLDLALGPHQPLSHGRLADQEGARDRGRGQAAERAQRKRDLRVDGQRRMTAGEDELESLVGKGRVVHRVLHCLGHLEQTRLRGQRAIAAHAIDGAVARRRHQPEARVGWDSVPRPALRGDREGLLRGFLGEVEVAEEADQCSEDACPLVAEGLLEDR
jgi:hypothetical protein